MYRVDCICAPLLCENDFIAFVIHNQAVRTGDFTAGIAVFIVNKDGEIVTRNNLFKQDIGAVFLKAVVLTIKCDIVWISPATANTYKVTEINLDRTVSDFRTCNFSHVEFQKCF